MIEGGLLLILIGSAFAVVPPSRKRVSHWRTHLPVLLGATFPPDGRRPDPDADLISELDAAD